LSTSIPTIIFDGDDTLWETQPIYNAVISEFYETLEGEGFERSLVRPVFTSINRDLLNKIKLSRNRLGKAMSQTYMTFCQQTDVVSEESVCQRLIDLADQVYTRAPRPMDQVNEVLTSLKKDFRLVFYSGGVEKIQRTRLSKLNLEHFFQEFVYVVNTKDSVALSTIVKSLNLDSSQTWMVGNSPMFDINPALSINLKCIWLHTSFWKEELEDISSKRSFCAFSLNEVLNIIYHEKGTFPKEYVLPSNTLQSISSASDKSEIKKTWVVGNSPKNDINPALYFGATPIWIPDHFNQEDIEPFRGSFFVAFSSDGAQKIIQSKMGCEFDSSKIIWRLSNKKGDLGGSIIVD
jgi:putative hydrolase of the HAD superfamily